MPGKNSKEERRSVWVIKRRITVKYQKIYKPNIKTNKLTLDLKFLNQIDSESNVPIMAVIAF
jgi:hypothetical protein